MKSGERTANSQPLPKAAVLAILSPRGEGVLPSLLHHDMFKIEQFCEFSDWRPGQEISLTTSIIGVISIFQRWPKSVGDILG